MGAAGDGGATGDGGLLASGAGQGSVGAVAGSSGGGIDGWVVAGNASVLVGLGPFCPVSLVASMRGDGTLSVSELLLIAAKRRGKAEGDELLCGR